MDRSLNRNDQLILARDPKFSIELCDLLEAVKSILLGIIKFNKYDPIWDLTKKKVCHNTSAAAGMSYLGSYQSQ